MKERPILFSGAMVRAILSGQKTQTRRVMQTQPVVARRWANAETDGLRWTWPNGDEATYADRPDVLAPYMERDFWPHCPYGQPGDRLWVRETWRTSQKLNNLSPARIALKAEEAGWKAPWAPIVYECDGAKVNWDPVFWSEPGKTRVSIHMPRWASRLTLEVTDVRVQRLQEISGEDAGAEGVCVMPNGCCSHCNSRGRNITYPGGCPHCVATGHNHRERFSALWDSINGERSGCSWSENPWVWCVSFRRLP